MRDSKPSATAYLIARSIFFLSREPQLCNLIPEQAAELSQEFAHTQPLFSRLFDRAQNSKLLRPLARGMERAVIPGIKLHYVLRKRYLEDVASDAISNGIRQIVVIGAGFDTLTLRIHERFPEARFFEVDHPATQRVKKYVVESVRPPTKNLHFVALDLAREGLEESLLKNEKFRAGDDTLFIAEGLLMYLSTGEVDRIFEFIRSHSGSQSRFAFTFMERLAQGRIGFHKSSRAVDAWLRLRGESFKWGIEPKRVKEFLAARGFKTGEIVTASRLREKYLAAENLNHLPLAEGECICTAFRD
jgi:methyltransferase (TIGR00027 family)